MSVFPENQVVSQNCHQIRQAGRLLLGLRLPCRHCNPVDLEHVSRFFKQALGGSTIIENIFAIPGLGSYVVSAIQNRDYPVIQGYVLVTGTTFVLITLAIDLLYILVNPKIRVQGGEP